MIASAVAGALGALAFAILIRVPRRELWLSALAGLVAGGVFTLVGILGGTELAQVFVAAIATTAVSEALARWRRAPATVYAMPGLIPLVPGLLAYHTMYDLVQGHFLQGATTAVMTFSWAAAIGVGGALVLTLVRIVAPSSPGR